MHFKPLRATLVFLAVAVLAACGEVGGTLPNALTTANTRVGSPGSISSACTHLGVPDASGHLRPEALCTAPPCPSTTPPTVACGPSGYPPPPSGCTGMGLPDGCTNPPGGGCSFGDPSCPGPPSLPRPTLPPGLVGLANWAHGEQCHSSLNKIDDDVPVRFSDDGHSVHNIYIVSASSTPLGGQIASGIMAYIYVNKIGEWYMGEDPNYPGNSLQIVGESIPIIGDFVKSIDSNGKNFDMPISAADVQKLKKNGNLGQSVSVQPCFKNVPSVS